ncbi:hypothetical protein BN2537_7619 [Streptomyces venezuelae]|nr:hypothetical protein BN2537_7619 [Streptomyces venezuelae]
MECCDGKVGMRVTCVAAIFAHAHRFGQSPELVRSDAPDVTPTTPRSGPPQYAVRMPSLVRRRHVDFVRVTSMSCRRSA